MAATHTHTAPTLTDLNPPHSFMFSPPDQLLPNIPDGADWQLLVGASNDCILRVLSEYRFEISGPLLNKEGDEVSGGSYWYYFHPDPGD